MSPKKREYIDPEITNLRIPNISNPPSSDGSDDFTIIQLNTLQNRTRELDRITQMAREGVFRKNLLLLRKERNLLTAIQHEQLRNFETAALCYERAATFAERLDLFDESNLYRQKYKSIQKKHRKMEKSRRKKPMHNKKDTGRYSNDVLESKPILPKGVTIPIVHKAIAEKFQKMRSELEEDEEELF
ncbi:MAG: hypothetical protein JW776_08560 [Candidatus Lokiarchaeota archaeon]|nr:hypothetical protein [Candidatus Lokiarchaeota archaeon]